MLQGAAYSSFPSENTHNWSAQPAQGQNATAATYSYAPSPVASSSGSAPWPPPSNLTPTPVVQQSSQYNYHAPAQQIYYTRRTLRGKKRTIEESEISNETAARVAARLAQDQAAVLNPDFDTPFQDEYDVVKRLLPYHIYQQPRDDLQTILNNGKGKGKSVNGDLQVEIEETKFAIQCHERLERLRRRWRNVKIREGQRASPSDQAYVLTQAVVETERTDTALLSGELKVARTELDRIQKEQRMAANAVRMTQFPSSASPPASLTPAPSTPVSTQQYYRSYPYSYAQTYGTPATQATTPAFSGSVAPTPAAPAPPTTYSPGPYQAGGAIPVQLPISSLAGLRQLGIVPVPTNSLPPEGQPQPPAILRGSSSNGTMLSLEINVSLLQSSQMTGLAMMLNSLVSRNASAMASSGPATATSASPPHPTTANTP